MLNGDLFLIRLSRSENVHGRSGLNPVSRRYSVLQGGAIGARTALNVEYDVWIL